MVQAAAEQLAELSDPSPNKDRPPRLATCINEHVIEPDRTAAGDGTWKLPDGENVTSDHLTDIVEWVCDMLEDDAAFASVWETPAGAHPNPTELAANPQGRNEETWARLVEQLFLGSAYSGPNIAAAFPSKGTVGGRAYRYIFERFCGSSSSGEPVIDDPAYSLLVACQHLTTYGAVSRGVTFDKDLAGVGIPASQAACSLPIFKDAWYSPAPIRVDGKPEKFASITSVEAHDGNAAAAKASGFGPGTIYTYNPARFTEFLLTEVHARDLLRDKQGNPVHDPDSGLPIVAPRAAQEKILEAQQAVKDADRARAAGTQVAGGLMKVKLPTPEKTDTIEGMRDEVAPVIDDTSEADRNASDIFTAKLPMRVQLDGSHVSMILRRYTTSGGKVAVQLLDTSAHRGGVGTVPLSDYRMFERLSQYRGIYASEGHTKIPAGTLGNFVGMGTLPPIKHPSTIFDNMRKARPVGLARLVIARRQGGRPDGIGATLIKEEDIYFISKMILMWSADSETRNFNQSRLLWSLRNTPWRQDIQAFWIVYGPCGPLAEVMWEAGARDRTLEEIKTDTLARANRYKAADKPEWKRLHTGRDTVPVAVLSHDEDGKSMQLWRAHCLNASGEGAVPKLIREAFIQTGSPPLSVILRKKAELIKAYQDEQNRRAKLIGEKNAERKKAHARAVKGEPGAAESAAALAAEARAIAKAPYPEVDELWDFAKDVRNEENYHDVFKCRGDLFRCYSNAMIVGDRAFSLPRLLR